MFLFMISIVLPVDGPNCLNVYNSHTHKQGQLPWGRDIERYNVQLDEHCRLILNKLEFAVVEGGRLICSIVFSLICENNQPRVKFTV